MRKLLRVRDVLECTGLGRSTMYTLIKEGKFPPPTKLSARCVAWDSTAVNQWIEERLAS